MSSRARDWYDRMNEVRHHLAHAAMGLDGLGRDVGQRLPVHELRSVRAALHGIMSVLDRWLDAHFPEVDPG